MSFDADVVVVGAGPIGLVNAWGMKRLNPNLKIVVLEKYQQYQRSHTLVMQYEQLEALMKATHSEQDPTLVELLEQLKKDPHIRTNRLQEIFSELATACGVEIKNEEIKNGTAKDQIATDYPAARVIIGADGTHSVVSGNLFAKGNQVKHEFDYVLQLRYEIKGEQKSQGIAITDFYQQMARKGLIANEYVGQYDEAQGKTPVTMQMMISKQDFLALKDHATSKNPIQLISNNKGYDANSTVELPRQLKAFLTAYLENKIKQTQGEKQEIDFNSPIRVSVNEAPATHAKQVFNKVDEAHVVLVGDAALGLSYFKGLNAGLEASAVFLNKMEPVIKNSFVDSKDAEVALQEYQDWFLTDFAPKKVKEVEQYSFWQIKSFMELMEVVRGIKLVSQADHDDDIEPAILDYFNYVTTDPLAKDTYKTWRRFPHRDYDPIKLGQWQYVPLQYSLKKIGKLLIDYFKPYKSVAQLVQDYKQPFVGLNNFFVGLAKMGVGFFTFDFKQLADGIFTAFRGTIEIITTPITWLVKPFFRGLATLIHGGFKQIEENEGIQRVVLYGHNYLNNEEIDLTANRTKHELLAVCNDLHRKFDKSVTHGQYTKLELEERTTYTAIRSEVHSDNILDKQKLIQYFSLFSPKRANIEVISNLDEPQAQPQEENYCGFEQGF